MKDKINGDKIGIYDGLLTIICADRENIRAKRLYLTAMGTPDDKFISLNDCLNLIEFDGKGIVTVIREGALHGEIYQYGNYGNFWVQHGTTNGYA